MYTDREFARLAEALGTPALADDDRFASVAARAEHDAELEATLTETLATRPAIDWEQASIPLGAGCVAVSMAGQAMVMSFDPALREGGLTLAYEHPVFGEMVRAAAPVTFSETPSRIAPPCRRGEQNRAILTELGYSEAEIDNFEASKVITAPDPLKVPERT